LLHATDGPGWEDPGAVYVCGVNALGSVAPHGPGVFTKVHVCMQRHGGM
jgi:hypothetical protein